MSGERDGSDGEIAHATSRTEREPEPHTTHEGEVANDLREIYNILSAFGNPRERNKRAKEKIAELTHELERTAWGETKPMDYVSDSEDRSVDTDSAHSEVDDVE